MIVQSVIVWFGSVRRHFSRNGSGSVRFDCVFKKTVQVRFGSTAFSKKWFEFGSDRLEPNRTVSVRFEFGSFSGSVV